MLNCKYFIRCANAYGSFETIAVLNDLNFLSHFLYVLQEHIKLYFVMYLKITNITQEQRDMLLNALNNCIEYKAYQDGIIEVKSKDLLKALKVSLSVLEKKTIAKLINDGLECIEV